MKYLKVFVDFAANLELLSDAERGRLFTAMLEYAETGKEIELKGNERFVWSAAKQNIDNQRSSYNNKVNGAEKARDKKLITLDINDNQEQSSRLRLISTQEQDKDKEQDKEQKKNKKFIIPTLAQVQDYCRERNNSVNAERFIDYYTANDWHVGKQKMKDWKAAVRLWERSSPKGKNSYLIESIRRDYESAGNKGMYIADVSIMDELQSTAER